MAIGCFLLCTVRQQTTIVMQLSEHQPLQHSMSMIFVIQSCLPKSTVMKHSDHLGRQELLLCLLNLLCFVQSCFPDSGSVVQAADVRTLDQQVSQRCAAGALKQLCC